MRLHELKTWPEYFRAIGSGSKRFEVRRNDRNFSVGDLLLLREWDPLIAGGRFSGDGLLVQVVYMMDGGQFGIEPGYCVLGIERIPLPDTFPASQ